MSMASTLENDEILLKITEHNVMERSTMITDYKVRYFRDILSHQIEPQFQCNTNQNPSRFFFFVATEKVDIYIYM